MSWFKRYRHSKGFGIHSPFAYRFITEVLEERLPYYDFDVIKDKRQRLVYRIACRFNPSVVCALGSANPQPMLMACPKATEGQCGHAQLVVAKGSYDINQLTDAINAHAAVIVIGKHQEQMATLTAHLDTLGYGMTFDNEKDMAIIVPNLKLPRQDFTARF